MFAKQHHLPLILLNLSTLPKNIQRSREVKVTILCRSHFLKLFLANKYILYEFSFLYSVHNVSLSYFAIIFLSRLLALLVNCKYFSLRHAKLFNYVAVTYYRFVIPFSLTPIQLLIIIRIIFCVWNIVKEGKRRERNFFMLPLHFN